MFQKIDVKLTTVTLVHTVIWVENDPLRDKIPEVFLARGLYVHQWRQAVGFVFLRGDLDRADEHRVRKFVPNPLHARRGGSVWDPQTLRIVIECHAGRISCKVNWTECISSLSAMCNQDKSNKRTAICLNPFVFRSFITGVRNMANSWSIYL